MVPKFRLTARRAMLAALAAATLVAGCARGATPSAVSARAGAFGARAAAAQVPFPAGFLWGVATAGHQIEGGDKTSNWAAWERAGRVAQPIGKAIDHWNRYEEDLDLAKGLGLTAFRLSLEWAKIEPEPGVFDPAAIKHYHDVLDAVRARGMEPIVTVVHFTYPAWLDAPDAKGRAGWEADRMPAEFARFAGWAAREYGAKVRWWLTLNEPNTYALVGYLAGKMPPGKTNPFAYRQVMWNQSRAHMLGYDAIHEGDADAMVSINPIMIHSRPDDPIYQPGPAPEKAPLEDLNGGLYFDALSFLDQFAPPAPAGGATPAPGAARTLDFMAFNYFYAVKPTELQRVADYGRWPIYPEGIYQVATKLHARYKMPLMVTENGMPTMADNPRGDGWNREAYLVNHLAQLNRAVAEGVPVLGYMHWTLVDNYEWGSYEPKFGLFGIDRRDPTLRRFRTPGADVYEAIVKANRIPDDLFARYFGRKS
jgi:beta-glucosidase